MFLVMFGSGLLVGAAIGLIGMAVSEAEEVKKYKGLLIAMIFAADRAIFLRELDDLIIVNADAAREIWGDKANSPRGMGRKYEY